MGMPGGSINCYLGRFYRVNSFIFQQTEPWESEKTLADMEYYDWDRSKSRDSLVTIHCWPNPPTDNDYETIPHVTEYKIAVSDLINDGEDEFSINKYKEAVKNMLALKKDDE